MSGIQGEIAEANKARDAALAEAQTQMDRVGGDIEALKIQFHEEYERRKASEQKRFTEIRAREEQGVAERRALLDQQEKQRLPHQVESIATTIWDELAVELRNQTFKTELDSAENNVPEAIRMIVSKSINEEFDLRMSLSSNEPLQAELAIAPIAIPQQIEEAPKNRRFQTMTLSGLGALVIGGFTYGVLPQFWSPNGGADRNMASIEDSGPLAWQTSYVDNILGLDGFLEFTKLQKTAQPRRNSLEKFFIKKLGLSKDKVHEFALAEGSLIWELKKLKQTISGTNQEQVIEKMRKIERKHMRKISKIIGGDKNLNTYYKFQSAEYRQYGR